MPDFNDEFYQETFEEPIDKSKALLERLKNESNLRVAEERKLQQIISNLWLKHGNDMQKVEQDAQRALENMRNASVIRMTEEERKLVYSNIKYKLDEEERRIKKTAEEELKHLTEIGAAQELIDARRKKFEDELANIRKQNIDSVIEQYEALRNEDLKSRETKSKALNSLGGTNEALADAEGIKAKAKVVKNDIKNAGSSLVSSVKSGNKDDIKEAGKALLNAATPLMKAGTLLRANADLANEQAKKSEERLKSLDDEWNARIEAGEDPNSPEMQLLKATRQEAKDQAIRDKNQAAKLNGMVKALDSIKGDYKKAFGEASTILNDYMGSIDARMQGSDKNFKDMSDMISNNLSVSPFVKTTKVLEKLKEATEKGISYNVEQRAFLAGLTDRIATTFDAFDSNLLRIIRLQQADSTASRLGMEASLTKLFNNMFQDTSYLSDVADSISGAIVDAQSQLDYKASAEFEYVIQKWLGALSSLGMSSESLTQIATGLNYIATGDVTSLASNSSLQTMFAMAASNANLEYSELLLNGLDASTTNKLLESMVVYLKDIADNSDNQVVKAAYGDIFNMSHSDMRALSNLTTAEISSLAGNNMSYDQMQKEVNNQFNQLASRTSLATMMTNVYDNVMYSMASDMVNNPVTFAMTKMLDWMKETETDIAIPFINAMGFGLDLNATVGDLMQMGLGITQAFSLTTNILQGLSSGGGLNLNAWGATETTQRGAGLNLGTLGTLGGTSGSIGTFAVSSNSSDAKTSSISSATDDSEETKKITNKNSKPPEKTIEDLYKAIVGESAESFVLSRDMTLRKVFNPTYEALQVRMNGLDILDGTLPVFDAALKMEVTSQLESIKTLMATHNTIGVQQVKIVDGTVIKVEKETIAAAIKEVLFADEDKNFNDLIDKVEGGTLKIDSVNQSVMVKNATGDKLQVSNLVW